MPDNTIQLAVIDMAGTTVADDGLVVSAFESAATAVGVPESGQERDNARQYVLDTMGQSKISVFRALFETEERAQQANTAFERAYEQLIDEGHAEPIDGAAQAITRLRDAGVKVALTTGFSGTTQEKLLAALGWQSLADLVLAPGDGVRGRPTPDLILTALMRLQVESGLRAGAAIAAGTLTGAHDEEQLRNAGATHVVGSVSEFADLILQSR
jgi:phosphonatase-like hydrolase